MTTAAWNFQNIVIFFYKNRGISKFVNTPIECKITRTFIWDQSPPEFLPVGCYFFFHKAFKNIQKSLFDIFYPHFNTYLIFNNINQSYLTVCNTLFYANLDSLWAFKHENSRQNFILAFFDFCFHFFTCCAKEVGHCNWRVNLWFCTPPVGKKGVMSKFWKRDPSPSYRNDKT